MNSEDISEKLRVWRVEPQVPPSFQREVWARIAARHAVLDDSFQQQAAQGMTSLLARPRFAFAFAVLTLALGLLVAHEQAQGAK